MQSSHINGRNNNGLVRSHHHHHGHGGHHLLKREPKPHPSNNAKTALENSCGGSSMLRSEEKERQRQEARAQRERSSRATAHHHAPTAADKSGNGGGGQEEEEEEEAAAAIFGVVQVAPNPNNEDHRQISDILGDFRQVYRHRTDLIGVDHQPPTPAPPAAHLHDPDTYTSYPPPTMDLQHHQPPPPSSSSTYAHRHHGSSRPHKQPPPAPPQHHHHHHHHHHHPPHPPSSSSSSAALYKTASNNNNNHHLKKKFTEGVKSGPGPGPGGPGGRVGVPAPAAPTTRGRPPRAKDPQVQKIMSEMSDLKSPVSAILPTPRPDHQSSFTFPPPPPPSTGGLIRGGPPSHEQHYHSKTGKSSDSRPSSFIASKSLENDKSSHVLSEESEGENDCGPPRVPEKHEPNGGTNGILRQDHLASKGPPVSPFKNTDDSSNSDDSSGSDSESSSSEDEGKQSPAPASPPASDKNPWSLENIFQQSNHKEESLLHEVGSTSKSLSMELATKDSHASSPLTTIDEPAPPVVTTVPDLTFTKLPSDVARSKGTLRPPVCSRSSLDDSSDDEQRPPPLPKQKSKKSASSSSSSRPKQISPSKISKIVEPNLSSESDDEKDPPPPPPPVSKMSSSRSTEQQQPHSKSPGRAPANNKHHHHHVSRKTPKKRDTTTTTRRRETEGISADREKSSERNFAVEEDEGDDESSDDLHRSSSSSTGNAAKFSSKKASASMRSSSLHSRKLPVSTAPSPPPSKQSHSKSVSQHHSTTTGPAAGDSRKRGGASHKESKRGAGGDVGKRVKDLEEEEEHIGTGKKQQTSVVLGGESRRSAPVQQSEPMPSARKKKDDAASKRRKRNECRTSEESNSVIERGEELDERGLRPPSSAATTITTTTSYKQSNTKVSLLNSVSYEGGVPKIVCEIPFKLIDRLPIINNTNSVKGVCAKDEKVNKEVLEMRTSGDVLKDKSSSNNSISSNSISNNNNNNMNSKSPPNEDATKLKQKAICSIYRKRQSSLEPDKVKREAVSDSSLEVQQQQGARSPHLPLKIELGHVKQESSSSSSKSLVKEETKSSLQKITPDGPLKRHGSSSSLSSIGTGSSLGSHSYSKRHKKDKRKEKEGSSKEEGKKNVKSESTKRRRHGTSPEPESAPPKKSRDSGRESSSSSSTSKGILGVTPKKRKSSSIPSRSPAKEAMGSPPQRGARNATASEERPSSLPTSEASIVSNQRNRTPHSISSQFSRKGSSLAASPHESEDDDDDDDIGIGGGSHNRRSRHGFSSCREKVDESNITNGGDISEYHSLPSSEHGSSSVYRNGEEHSSPPLELGSGPQQHLGGILDCSGQMYPPSPRPSTVEGNNALILNRESTTSSENPVYFSYFERKIPEILKDNTQYLITAKELKHQADKERHRIFQTIIYLEAVLYFILTGESMESDPNTYVPSYTMYNDTFKLIRHVSSPIFKGPGLFDKTLGLKDNSYYKNVILAILSLRCQSLLALKLIYMKRKEMKEVQHIVCDFLKVNVTPVAGRHPTSSLPASTPSVSSGAGGGTPSGVAWGGSQRSAANNSPPSSLSPTPSPAGSVGSEGSQSSSGYSTEGTRNQRAQHPPMGATPPQATAGMISIPPDIYPFLIRHCQLSFDLHSSHEMWRDADDLVYMHDMKEFFIDLDHKMGPLTFHSSLRELVNYVQTALDKLKK